MHCDGFISSSHSDSHDHTQPMAHHGVPRIHAAMQHNALNGEVRWAPVRSLWWFAMTSLALIAGPATFSWQTVIVFFITSGITLCLGHSLGMHRRLIHQAYQCPLWLEYFFVWCGTLVGMAGPIGMARTHDLRDWAQRQTACHDYFAHRQSFWRDAWWQLHCEIALDNGPRFVPEPRLTQSRFYRWVEATWMWQQAILAALLYALGSWDFVVWGVCVRVVVSLTGHWLIGHFAHRSGGMRYHVDGAGVQGYNVALPKPLTWLTGLLSMGEAWHNNHHAFPGSAKLGLHAGQLDPGWWILQLLIKLHLAWDIHQPADLPLRLAVHELKPQQKSGAFHGA